MLYERESEIIWVSRVVPRRHVDMTAGDRDRESPAISGYGHQSKDYLFPPCAVDGRVYIRSGLVVAVGDWDGRPRL